VKETCFLCHEVVPDDHAIYLAPSGALGHVWTPPKDVPDNTIVRYNVKGVFNSNEQTYVCAGCLRLRAKFNGVATAGDYRRLVKAKSAVEAMEILNEVVAEKGGAKAEVGKVPELYAEFTEGTSNKFYRVMWSTTTSSWMTYYGRIGTKGTFQSHSAPTSTTRLWRCLWAAEAALTP
jgi:hypothetical protein